MIISNWWTHFGPHGSYKNILALKGLNNKLDQNISRIEYLE